MWVSHVDFQFVGVQFSSLHPVDSCFWVAFMEDAEIRSGSESDGQEDDGGIPDLDTIDSDDECDVGHKDTTFTKDGVDYWIPECPPESKPCIGMVFGSIDDAAKFYRNYGLLSGFDTRSGSSKTHRSDGTVLRKHFYCNREGSSRPKNYDTAKAKFRKCSSFRIGCKATMTIKFAGCTGYTVSDFSEQHNHVLMVGDGKQFLKSRRKMSVADMEFVFNLGKVNVGSVRAHKIATQLAGGYGNVGPQVNDFRNCQRDMVSFIGEHDAQMTVEKLEMKKALYSSFFYECKIVDNALFSIFWADSISQMHFHAFGDVVTFDATYSLNRYNLIFVPFTGIDNHKNSVTFAAALMSSEDMDSYTWILECFLKCMGRAPSIVLTDQDPALRVVVPKVMPNTHHRYCIWHIMKKLSDKVGFNTPKLQEFRAKLKSVVYDYHIETSDFEVKWNELIAEYDMLDNKWLSSMFSIREFWIPAYFRDIPLGGLLRTTSRSESANSFFGGFLNPRLTLLGFFMGFDSALETQRHTQTVSDQATMSKKGIMRTLLTIECHAETIYTRDVFHDVQAEICASLYEVTVKSVVEDDNGTVHHLRDPRYQTKTFQVSADSSKQIFECSCKMFERVGFLCRHVFKALQFASIDIIPTRYILNRWTRNPSPTESHCVDKILANDCKTFKKVANAYTDLWMDFTRCLNLCGNDTSKRDYIGEKLKEIAMHLEGDGHPAPTHKEDTICAFLGAPKPSELTIMSPAIVHTKGSGKRMISERDEAITKHAKTERKCRTCCTWGFHDSRTCPLKRSAGPP